MTQSATTEWLETELGYAFQTPALLAQALTHRSAGQMNNERLEFLGDAVLNCAVSTLIYSRFKRVDEGNLSRIRANLVKQQTLYEIAQKLKLSQFVKVGEGEQKSGGFRRPSILADCTEAIFGAIFLDSGFEAARNVIERLYEIILDSIEPESLGKDSKTKIQELLQARKLPLPVYRIVARHGVAHSQEFEVECLIDSLGIHVSGNGTTRRTAEQLAARRALERLQEAPLPVVKNKTRSPKVQLSLLGIATRQSPDNDNH